MSNIESEKLLILNMRRGEDVRDAFISACKKITSAKMPDVSTADEGKYLRVDTSGKWTAETIVLWTLSAIAVTTQPTTTTYTVGDTLDLTGAVVTSTHTSEFADSYTEDVTASCTFSPADGDTLSEAGTQAVSVSYTESGTTVTTSFNVTVEAAQVEEEVNNGS